MKKLILAVSIAAISASVSAIKTDAYVTDRFENLVRDSLGHCVRTGTWTPEKALKECGDTPPAAKEPIKAVPEQHDPVVDDQADLRKEIVVTPLPIKSDGILRQRWRVHFEFDKAVLSDADKHNLDQYVDYLKATTNEAHVTGWADRVGTDKYNMTLSTLRAIAVTRHLMKAGVRVTDARGMGESHTQVCPGNATPEVKQCLAADRYADIVVQTQQKQFGIGQ